jgi:hypothetical protein
MAQPDIELDTEALRRHAGMVDEAAAMSGEAAGAAAYLNLHDEVYGEWTGPLIVPWLNQLQDTASRELRNGADATSHLADLLRSVADGADITDGNAAQRLKRGPA